MQLKVSRVTERDLEALQIFCTKAASEGYKNNSSFKVLKMNELEEGKLAYWALYQQEKMVGLSGCQALPQLGEGCFRVLFRACMLPGVFVHSGLARSPFTASPLWKLILPFQKKWAREHGANHLVISVNCPGKEGSLPRSMEKVNRVLAYMCRAGTLTLWQKEAYLYHTYQDIYILND